MKTLDVPTTVQAATPRVNDAYAAWRATMLKRLTLRWLGTINRVWIGGDE